VPDESLGVRAKWTIAALIVTAVLDVVAVASDWSRYDLLGRIVSGGSFTLAEANASDHRQAVIGGVQIGVLLVTAIIFIWWFHRAYRNLDALGGERRFGTGWAIGGWFVPILNLWRPKQIANDIWRGSDPTAVFLSDPAASSLLTAWWLVFLASAWASQVAGRLAFAGNTARDLQKATTAYLVGDSLDIIAAALAILVVWKLTMRQRERAGRRAAGPSSTPA
jgi:hypothetical protein